MEKFSEEERALARRFAAAIVDRRMALPATLFLESMSPLNFVGSQALHFFNPVLSVVFSFKEVEKFAAFIEKRESVALVVGEIEALEEKRRDREAEQRKAQREQRRQRREARRLARAERRSGTGRPPRRWWLPW